MNYAEARSLINSGDPIGVEFNTPLAFLVRIGQRIAGLPIETRNITHTCTAWWVEGRLYSVEMDGMHNVLRPMSQIVAKAAALHVYECPVPLKAMQDTFDMATSNPISYPILDLVRIGLRLALGIPNGGDGDKSLVCSTFTARWLEWAGWIRPESMPNMPSPAEVVAPFNLKFILKD
jgi:hypothetical protein